MLDMLMILTTAMKFMLPGMQIQIHILHQGHFLYVNDENEYSFLPLEAYDENNIWSMHNHLIFIPFVFFYVSCSSLFLDDVQTELTSRANNKFRQKYTNKK